MTANESQRWLSPQEAADYIGIHVSTLKRHIPPEDLPYLAVGPRRDRKYNRDDLDEFIRARMITETRRPAQ